MARPSKMLLLLSVLSPVTLQVVDAAYDRFFFTTAESDWKCPDMPYTCIPPSGCAYNGVIKKHYCCDSTRPEDVCFAGTSGGCSADSQQCGSGRSKWCCLGAGQETCTQTTSQINVCWATGPNPLGELKLSADVINKTFSSLSSAAGSSATALPFALDDLPVSSASSTSTSTSTLSSASTSTSGSTSTSTSTASTASTSSTSTSTSTDSSNSSASSASSAASSSASSSTNLSGGAIAGIVIGVLAGIILAALGAFFLWKRNKGQQHQPYQLDAPLYGHGQDVKYADSLKQAHEVFVPPAEMYTPTAELSTPTAEMYSPPVEMEARDGLTRRVDGNGL